MILCEKGGIAFTGGLRTDSGTSPDLQPRSPRRVVGTRSEVGRRYVLVVGDEDQADGLALRGSGSQVVNGGHIEGQGERIRVPGLFRLELAGADRALLLDQGASPSRPVRSNFAFLVSKSPVAR